jgi:hypothetical protein
MECLISDSPCVHVVSIGAAFNLCLWVFSSCAITAITCLKHVV